MNYKAEFEMDGCVFFIEMHGGYNYCFEAAKYLAKKLGAHFTGILEELK